VKNSTIPHSGTKNPIPKKKKEQIGKKGKRKPEKKERKYQKNKNKRERNKECSSIRMAHLPYLCRRSLLYFRNSYSTHRTYNLPCQRRLDKSNKGNLDRCQTHSR